MLWKLSGVNIQTLLALRLSSLFSPYLIWQEEFLIPWKEFFLRLGRDHMGKIGEFVENILSPCKCLLGKV